MEQYFQNTQSFNNLQLPKAIIFDWDNTLVNSWPIIQQAIDKTMIAMNKEPWGLEKVRNNVHKSMRESFPEIFGNNWQDAGEIYKKSYQDNSTNLQLLPLAKDFLELIKKQNILAFLVSNKIGSSLRKEVEMLKLNHLFANVIGAQDAEFDKPYPHPAQLAISNFSELINKNEAEKIWFIGDTIADIECSYYCGFQPILFSESPKLISKTIDPKLIKSTDFNNDFKNIAKYYDKFVKNNVISNKNSKILPIVFGYKDLLNKFI